MTTFRDFCDGVLKNMPRATNREREDIREELLDHLSEHRDLLLEYGYEPLEAEQKAIKAMGDPDEIGQAWNKTLSPLWLWLGRLCAAAFAVLLFFNLTNIYGKVETIADALQVRYSADAQGSLRDPKGCDLLWSEDPGIEENFGEHIIRIHQVQLWQDRIWKDYYFLRVCYVSYHRDPWGHSLSSAVFRAIEYTGATPDSGGSSQSSYATWYEQELKLQPGQDTVGIYLEHMGNEFTAELELDWGGAST